MSKLKTDYKSLKENKEMRIKEIRADEATNEDGTKKMVVEGYASVFDEETLIEALNALLMKKDYLLEQN